MTGRQHRLPHIAWQTGLLRTACLAQLVRGPVPGDGLPDPCGWGGLSGLESTAAERFPTRRCSARKVTQPGSGGAATVRSGRADGLTSGCDFILAKQSWKSVRRSPAYPPHSNLFIKTTSDGDCAPPHDRVCDRPRNRTPVFPAPPEEMAAQHLSCRGDPSARPRAFCSSP